LFLGILPAIAFDLNDEMEQVVDGPSVVHQHDEVGQIFADLRAVAIGHFEAQVVIFRITDNLRWDSATRQNSASQSLSRMTQLTWFLASGPLVSHRSAREVVKRTCAVEPVGL